MSRFSLWYRGLSRRTRLAISVMAGVLAALVAGVAIYYTFLAPRMVEVRSGTIIYDPVDGHVWEDSTETLTVSEKDAANYSVQRVERLSEEHAAIKAAEDKFREEEAARLRESTGLEAVSGGLTEENIAEMEDLQESLAIMGEGLVNGMDMVNQLYGTRAILVGYRNQVADMSMPPEMAEMKARIVQVFDLYIAAIDSFIDYAAKMDPAYVDQAQAYLDQANALLQGLVPQQ